MTSWGIAVAVIMSDDRVLLIRRAVAEGGLSWQFPGGKVGPRETAEEAAVREALEETGVQVAVTRPLGERVHPGTGTRIAYLACALAGGTARAASPREVAEARWVSAQDADDLTGGTIYEPVRRYLRSALPFSAQRYGGTAQRGRGWPARPR